MKVKLDDGAFLPDRAHHADAGYDLRCMDDITIPANGNAVINTGVHMRIPFGYYGLLESKSGLNVKHNIVSLGGTIDSGYTGAIQVKLYNLSDNDYNFVRGDKIVQIVIMPVATPSLVVVDELDETDRGDKGFGSSGR